MKVDISKAKWTMDADGTWLSVRVSSVAEATKICDGIEPNKPYTIEISKKRKKRSKDANAYMWELCQQLAEVNGTTKEDVYREAIKDVGVFKDFENMTSKDAQTLRTAWEMLGTAWMTEQVDYMPDGEHLIIRCYYGSSVYNTKQMSRLIDYIVQDCKACGIETMTPSELALLESEWGK